MFSFGAEQSAPKIIAKIENSGFKSWLPPRYATQVQLMVTAKSEICFDLCQFVGGAENLKDKCFVVI